jgi:hypothetical protein
MSNSHILRAVEYITPLPSPEDTVAIIEEGVAVPGQEVCNERLHSIPEEALRGVPFHIPVSEQTFMVELTLPEGYGFTHAATSTRAIDCSGPFPMLLFPHPGERLTVSIDKLNLGK